MAKEPIGISEIYNRLPMSILDYKDCPSSAFFWGILRRNNAHVYAPDPCRKYLQFVTIAHKAWLLLMLVGTHWLAKTCQFDDDLGHFYTCSIKSIEKMTFEVAKYTNVVSIVGAVCMCKSIEYRYVSLNSALHLLVGPIHANLCFCVYHTLQKWREKATYSSLIFQIWDSTRHEPYPSFCCFNILPNVAASKGSDRPFLHFCVSCVANVPAPRPHAVNNRRTATYLKSGAWLHLCSIRCEPLECRAVGLSGANVPKQAARCFETLRHKNVKRLRLPWLLFLGG